jgi:predicted TPR repeat methyltransferase
MTDSEDVIKMSDDFASEYDASVGTKHWYGPEVLFGLMYEYLKPGQLLLDIGTGTGMSARMFHSAGLRIYGVDGSEKMLKYCKEKKMAEGLKKMDLTTGGDPFPGRSFDHIISIGVFHILGDLKPVFKTIDEKITSDGIVGFTVDDKVSGEHDDYTESDIEGIYVKRHHKSGIMMYKHHERYISHLLNIYRYDILKKLRFLAFFDEEQRISYYFEAYIVKKQGAM